MDEIRLRDYRCFREEQTARLAPLTLLVGENSTGKTSFPGYNSRPLGVRQRLQDPGLQRRARMILAVSTKLLTSEAGGAAEPKPSLRDSVR